MKVGVDGMVQAPAKVQVVAEAQEEVLILMEGQVAVLTWVTG